MQLPPLPIVVIPPPPVSPSVQVPAQQYQEADDEQVTLHLASESIESRSVLFLFSASVSSCCSGSRHLNVDVDACVGQS